MYVYLSKILPFFVLPLGIVIILVFTGLALLLMKKRRLAMLSFVLSLAVLWIASTPLAATSIYRHLESGYPPIEISSVPVSGCMVLLGGAVAPPMAPRVRLEFNDAADRVFTAAELYESGKAPLVIVSGGNQPWSESPWSEAELIKGFLMRQGIPKEAILLEGSSRNTRENALNTRNILNSVACEVPLLITSAAHMPRAVAAFQSLEIDVVPISTDVRVAGEGRVTVMSFIPDAQALVLTSAAIREWLGQWYYSHKGWN